MKYKSALIITILLGGYILFLFAIKPKEVTTIDTKFADEKGTKEIVPVDNSTIITEFNEEEIKAEKETKELDKEEKTSVGTKVVTEIKETKKETPVKETKETSKTEPNVETEKPKEESTVTEEPKTLKEQNAEIINYIKIKFGYEVSYGDEEFWFGGVASTLLTDEEKANKALTDLKKKSALFPDNFFKTFQGYNGFRVILFDHIEDAAGVTSYEFGDDNIVAIDVNTGFLGRVFYHELFHIMEQYIKYKTYGSSFPFENWNSYNPAGFTYANTDDYKYTVYDLNDFYGFDNPSEIAFVSLYAKSKPNEDRAELFADLMFRAIKKNYMYKGFGVNEKAKSLALVLRQYFNSAGARWEKYIDWS